MPEHTSALRAAATALMCVALVSGCSNQQEQGDRPGINALSQKPVPLQITELDETVAAIAEETGTEVAISIWDGDKEIISGDLRSLSSWSTEKVPIALAAQEHCELDDAVKEQLITSAITYSDNNSTEMLYTCMGGNATAAEYVSEVIGRSGADVYMDPVWGESEWPVSSQAHFAYYLSTLPEDNIVIQSMANVVPQQSWGIGEIEGMHFKGGWSDSVEDGSYQNRQMGFITVEGTTYGIAIAARSEIGSMMDTIDALNRLGQMVVSWNDELMLKPFVFEAPAPWEV